jgi:hypothetical protein
MKDEQLKNIWNMINDKSGILDYIPGSTEQLISQRSESIQDKIRGMLQNDLILKVISGIAFILNLVFYHNNLEVVYVCIAGVLFLAIMTTIEWKTLQGFNKIADPGLATRDNLSNILVYLRRKANLYQITIASSQVLIFVPGVLLYFYLVYGQVKPMTGEAFVVFTLICLIGTIAFYLKTKSQIKFHIKHLTVSLTDLNEDSLGMAYDMIESQRKQDASIKMLTYFLLGFGFVILIVILKSITG